VSEDKDNIDQTVNASFVSDDPERLNFLSKIAEATIGAFRHLLEKHLGNKGFPVGFAIVFYNPDSEKKWYYDMRVILEPHDPNVLNRRVRERIGLVNQFLCEGIKRILDGKHDDMAAEVKDKDVYYVPGAKGRV